MSLVHVADVRDDNLAIGVKRSGVRAIKKTAALAAEVATRK